jgi:Transposase DNA-binding/Transposase Tn5 dimerisation domain
MSLKNASPLHRLIVTHKFDPDVHCVRIDTMRQTLRPEQVRLGDKRLDARFLKIVDDFSKDPTASIPEASGGWAASKAAYRFFDNPGVRPDDIRAALRRAALEYLPPGGPILAIQDTTSLDFTDHPATAGLGYMEHPKHSGLFMHSVLAVTPEGVPCGIIDQRTWARDPAGLGKRAARHKKDTAAKESRRWLDALAATEAALSEGREVITVADREADIYDLFAHPRRPGSHLLIRVKPRRGVRHPGRLLGPALRGGPARGTMAVDLRRADDRPPRRAVLTIRSLATEVAPPVNRAGRGGLPHVALTAILVEEEDPPAGQEAVRWWLVTSLPIRTTADVERAVRYYALRWLVERYHFTMKSGCRVEQLQLQRMERLDRAVATYSAVAWRLLWLTYEARRHPERSCERVLRREEWGVLCLATGGATDAPPALRDAVRRIARLGGFLGRKGDGEPGVKTLWRGLRRLNDMVAGYDLKPIHISCRCAGKE